MLTSEDIKNLTAYLLDVFKDVFVTKEDLQVLEAKFDTLQTVVDAIAKNTEMRGQEIASLSHRMKNAENWIDAASPKLGINLEH